MEEVAGASTLRNFQGGAAPAARDAPFRRSVNATADARILVTRDRHLAAAARGKVTVVRLAVSEITEQARALRAALGIDWQYAPFTRCLVDNTPLDPAPPAMAAQVPPLSRAAGGPLRVCPECGRLYWLGGHVRRMLARLAEWSVP